MNPQIAVSELPLVKDFLVKFQVKEKLCQKIALTVPNQNPPIDLWPLHASGVMFMFIAEMLKVLTEEQKQEFKNSLPVEIQKGMSPEAMGAYLQYAATFSQNTLGDQIVGKLWDKSIEAYVTQGQTVKK